MLEAARSLKLRQRELPLPDTHPLRVRLHRAISWLQRAGREHDDPDARFVFLWVALNAAYAQEFGSEQREREQLSAFFSRLVAADPHRCLHALLFGEFTGPIRTLIDNHFVFEPFWRALRTHDSSERWKEGFDAGKRKAMRALMDGDTATVLAIVCDRLYVLRNQLVHGGATWNSAVNRQQVRDGAAIMARLVPIVIELMLERPDDDWGAIGYPVV
jgi:hypothetical protein